MDYATFGTQVIVGIGTVGGIVIALRRGLVTSETCAICREATQKDLAHGSKKFDKMDTNIEGIKTEQVSHGKMLASIGTKLQIHEED